MLDRCYTLRERWCWWSSGFKSGKPPYLGTEIWGKICPIKCNKIKFRFLLMLRGDCVRLPQCHNFVTHIFANFFYQPRMAVLHPASSSVVISVAAFYCLEGNLICASHLCGLWITFRQPFQEIFLNLTVTCRQLVLQMIRNHWNQSPICRDNPGL